MSKIYLRVKIKSLAEEAKMIRLEEHRQKAYRKRKGLSRPTPEFWSLREHRTIDVRNEARASLLAYAYLRGMAYHRCEHPKSKLDPNILVRASKLAEKYGPRGQIGVLAEMKAWTEATPEECLAAA